MSGYLYLSAHIIADSEDRDHIDISNLCVDKMEFVTTLFRKSDIYRALEIEISNKKFTLVRIFNRPRYSTYSGIHSTSTIHFIIQETIPELYDKLA